MRQAAVLAVSSVLLFSPLAAVAAPVSEPDTGDRGTVSGAPGANGSAGKSDDRPDAAADERRALNQQGVEKVVRGEAPVQNRGGSQAVQVAPGQWAEYGLQDSDQILSFLIEFGDQVDPRFPASAPGPAHNRIQIGRASCRERVF